MPVVIPAASGSSSALQSVPTQNVFDYLYDSQGNARKGAPVIVTLNVEAANSITPQVSLTNVIVQTTTDNNGFWSVNLIPNANINPANTTYSVQIPGQPAYEINIPSAGGPFQSTSPAVLVNTPGVLAPATTGITGNLTVSGNESVTGTLGVSGATTLAGTTTGALSTGTIAAGGDVTIGNTFRLLFASAVSKLVGGATSFSVRDNADANDNLLVSNAGDVTVRARLLLAAAVSKLVPGATSFSVRDTADANDNLIVTNAGNATVRGTLTASNVNTTFHAEVWRSTNQAITLNTLTTIVFDSVLADPNSSYNSVTGVYTCPVPGRYLVCAAATYSNNATAVLLQATHSGADTKVMSNPGNSVFAIGGSAVVRAAASDTLKVQIQAGASANVVSGESASWATFTYLGPL